MSRIFCTHPIWKFQRVPTNQLSTVKQLYDSKDTNGLQRLYLKYNVITSGICTSCDNSKTILDWTFYAYDVGWLI